MLFFLIPLLADIWLWYALLTDLKKRNMVLRTIVLVVKATLTAALIYLVITIAAYRGEFAEPVNAYRQIVFGAITALNITAGSLYLIMVLLTWVPGRLLNRKLKAAGIVNITLFLLVVIIFADGYFRQRFDVRIVRDEVPVKDLDPALSGMKIVVIGDLHLSSWHRHYDRLEGVMAMVASEEPDLLVNTGDFITFGWQEYGSSDTILRKAGNGSSAFAVAGNHDDGTYHPDYDESYGAENSEKLASEIAASGYQLLSDTVVITRYNDVDIAVAGVVTHGHRLDMSYGDFEKVMGQIPDSLFTVMLLHDPAGWLLTAVNGRMPQITLSGHTHGMQAGMPGGGSSPAARYHERWKGHYRFGNSHLYVTTGLGTSGMALRLFMPPEIVILTVIPE
ncbi:MAG: metallophosphoesterase [Bacteroidales bacterium]